MVCGAIEAIQTGCELSNNLTIITELAVGGGLAIFFFFMQRRTTKKQTDVWNKNRELGFKHLLKDLSTAEFYVEKYSTDRGNDLLDILLYVSETLTDYQEFIDPEIIGVLERHINLMTDEIQSPTRPEDEVRIFLQMQLDLMKDVISKYDSS